MIQNIPTDLRVPVTEVEYITVIILILHGGEADGVGDTIQYNTIQYSTIRQSTTLVQYAVEYIHTPLKSCSQSASIPGRASSHRQQKVPFGLSGPAKTTHNQRRIGSTIHLFFLRTTTTTTTHTAFLARLSASRVSTKTRQILLFSR